MKKYAVALPFAVGAFLLSAGCGDDVTKTTVVNETTGISQLAKGDTLPECSGENAGEMLYAVDSGAVYHCTGKAWATLNGADGKDGSDGKNGTDGESCEAVALKDGSGYKILCGEDSIGVVLNGAEGAKGDSGATGETGAAGEGCTVTDDGEGSVTVTCAGDTVELTKALCSGKPYDPAKSFCFELGTLEDTVITRCDGQIYDFWNFFCAKDSVITKRCGWGEVDTFDIDLQYCGQDDAGNETILDKKFVTTAYLNQTMLENGKYGTLLDERDGQVYRTVKIGEQTWMAQNLNYDTTTSKCSGIGCAKGGRLYQIQNIYTGAGISCPEGWMLPSKEQWITLLTTVGWTDAQWNSSGEAVSKETLGGKLVSSVADESWSDSWTMGTDDFGFAAVPAGWGYYNSTSSGVSSQNEGGEATFLASGFTFSSNRASLVKLFPSNVQTTSYQSTSYYSVRCIKK